VRLAREIVVDSRGRFEVRDIRFLQIAAQIRVSAGPASATLAGKTMRFGNRHAQIKHQIFSGQAVDFVFELLEPSDEFVAPLDGHARALVRQIRRDVAIGEDGLSGGQLRVERRLGFEAIARIEQGGKMRIDGCENAPPFCRRSRRSKGN
jgi:hypothetical protein